MIICVYNHSTSEFTVIIQNRCVYVKRDPGPPWPVKCYQQTLTLVYITHQPNNIGDMPQYPKTPQYPLPEGRIKSVWRVAWYEKICSTFGVDKWNYLWWINISPYQTNLICSPKILFAVHFNRQHIYGIWKRKLRKSSRLYEMWKWKKTKQIK